MQKGRQGVNILGTCGGMGWRPWQGVWCLTSLEVEATKWWPGPTQTVPAVPCVPVHPGFTLCSLSGTNSPLPCTTSRGDFVGLAGTGASAGLHTSWGTCQQVHLPPGMSWYWNLSLENQILPLCDHRDGHNSLFLSPFRWKQKWGEQHGAFSANGRKTLTEK